MEPTTAPTTTDNEELVIGLSVGGGAIVLSALAVSVYCFWRRKGDDGDEVSSNGAGDDDQGVSRDYTEIPDDDGDARGQEENDTTSEIVMA